MKRIPKIITLIMMVLPFAACEDFLDIKPQGQLTQEVFPTTESDAVLATNAAYTTLRQWHYHSGGYPILDFMSDDAHKGSNPNDQVATLGVYETFDHTATGDGLDRWWSTLYEGVKRTNTVIEKVPGIDMTASLRDRLVGEAHFVRGLLYFDLVRAWGAVPLVTTTEPPLKLHRTSADSIYDFIVTELEEAIDLLPLKSSYEDENLGRASKGAAQALLAKVCLFMQDYENAELYALEVIESDEYDLEPVFADANGVNGENGVESVFEIGALSVAGGESGGNQYANTQGVRGSPNRGWGFNRPSLDLQNSFEEDDPRLDATVIFLGEVLDGVEILGDGSTPDEMEDDQGNVIQIECYNQKVWVPGLTTDTQFGHNRRILRYADVLLIAAEALNENNKPGPARNYLNMVRERAREGDDGILPDITENDKELLRDLILEERRHELALEQHRFWDLVRTGKAEEILGPHGFKTGKNELLPIPQTELDISQGSLEQNPEYE
jgi:starch-binding outer membrane protein, SusD/RagB family